MKKVGIMILLVLLTFLIGSTTHADQLDLSTFTVDGDVTLLGGTVTIDETSGLWSSYFYDDFFAVDSNALELSFDFSLLSGADDIDWLVMTVDDGTNYWYDLEITGTQSGSHVFDLTSYQGSSISLTFGLEADMFDLDLGSIATFTNFDISYDTTQSSDPVPEPASLILLATGLVGLAGFYRKKLVRRY